MIDLNSDKADDILKVLFFLAPVMGLVTARTIMLAQLKMDGQPRFRIDRLMRITVNDFTVFGMTLVASLIVFVTALSSASFAYVLDVLTAARSEMGLMGWALTIIWWLHIVAPFAVGLMLYIGRRRRLRDFGHVPRSKARELGLYLG